MSVVVRFHNEGLYLRHVLQAVRAQRGTAQVEVIAVDNRSTDDSRKAAEEYADKVLDIDEYRPGAALNQSIHACSGEQVVVLSAHALPACDTWLAELTAWLRNPDVLGIYGAQLYPATSKFLDKRDLDIFSDLRPRTERTDSDLWNANSAFHRMSWEEEPFNETVIELEDHYWTKCHLARTDRWVRFEPSALVYHYGHEERNDREYLPSGTETELEHIDRAVAVLADFERQPWPAVMSAGLTLGTLRNAPGIQRAVPVLGRCLLEHPDFDVRWRMASALGRIVTADSVTFLLQGLSDRSFYPRDECAWSLARLGEVAVPGLLAAADKRDPPVRPFVALALGRSGTAAGESRAVALAEELLASTKPSVIRDGLYFLGEYASARGAPCLAGSVAAHLAGGDEVARAAAWCWGTLAEAAGSEAPSAREIIEVLRLHPLETVRLEAVVAVGRLARVTRSSALLEEVGSTLSRDPSGRVRYGAMHSLRLAAISGSVEAVTIAAGHGTDSDNGVNFERQLAIAGKETDAT